MPPLLDASWRDVTTFASSSSSSSSSFRRSSSSSTSSSPSSSTSCAAAAAVAVAVASPSSSAPLPTSPSSARHLRRHAQRSTTVAASARASARAVAVAVVAVVAAVVVASLATPASARTLTAADITTALASPSRTLTLVAAESPYTLASSSALVVAGAAAAGLVVRAADGVARADVVLDCASGYNSFFRLESVSNVTFERVTFSNCDGYSDGAVTLVNASSVRFAAVAFEANRYGVMTSAAVDAVSSRVHFDGCLFRSNTEAGARLYTVQGVTFSGCTFEVNGRVGLHIEPAAAAVATTLDVVIDATNFDSNGHRNNANCYTGCGGFICRDCESLKVSNTNVRANRARLGPIVADGSRNVDVTNLLVALTSYIDSNGYDAGAPFSCDRCWGSFVMRSSTFRENGLSNNGRGWASSSLVLTNAERMTYIELRACRFENSSAVRSSRGVGVAVSNFGAAAGIVIEDTHFSDLRGRYSTAVHLVNVTAPASVRIAGSSASTPARFERLSTSENGNGAIVAESVADLRLEDVVIDDSSGYQGAALFVFVRRPAYEYALGNVSLNRVVVSNCTAHAPSGSSSQTNAAVTMQQVDVASITSSSFMRNRNEDADVGALEIRGWQRVDVRDTRFEENTAYRQYGGVLLQRANSVNGVPQTTAYEINVERCYFRANVARGNSGTQNGGALAIIDVASASLINSTFIDNRVGRPGGIRGGGAVYVNANNLGDTGLNASLVASNCIFDRNAAPSHGGAIYADNVGRLAAVECDFRHNRAGDAGGAIAATDYALVELERCVFDSNSAMDGPSGSGGAVYVQDANTIADRRRLLLAHSRFAHNRAAVDGGAVFVQDGDDVDARATTFEANVAYRDGGAVWARALVVAVANASFTNNTAADDAGGIDFTPRTLDAAVRLENVHFEDNYAGNDAYDVALRGDGRNVTIERCGFHGGASAPAAAWPLGDDDVGRVFVADMFRADTLPSANASAGRSLVYSLTDEPIAIGELEGARVPVNRTLRVMLSPLEEASTAGDYEDAEYVDAVHFFVDGVYASAIERQAPFELYSVQAHAYPGSFVFTPTLAPAQHTVSALVVTRGGLQRLSASFTFVPYEAPLARVNATTDGGASTSLLARVPLNTSAVDDAAVDGNGVDGSPPLVVSSSFDDAGARAVTRFVSGASLSRDVFEPSSSSSWNNATASIAAWVYVCDAGRDSQYVASTATFALVLRRDNVDVNVPSVDYAMRAELVTRTAACAAGATAVETTATSSDETIGVGAWHHVVGVFDGAASTVYVDGRAASASARAASTLPSASASLPVCAAAAAGDDGLLFVGANAGGANADFRGAIADVRLYTSALSAADALGLFTASGGGSTSRPGYATETTTASDVYANRTAMPLDEDVCAPLAWLGVVDTNASASRAVAPPLPSALHVNWEDVDALDFAVTDSCVCGSRALSPTTGVVCTRDASVHVAGGVVVGVKTPPCLLALDDGLESLAGCSAPTAVAACDAMGDRAAAAPVGGIGSSRGDGSNSGGGGGGGGGGGTTLSSTTTAAGGVNGTTTPSSAGGNGSSTSAAGTPAGASGVRDAADGGGGDGGLVVVVVILALILCSVCAACVYMTIVIKRADSRGTVDIANLMAMTPAQSLPPVRDFVTRRRGTRNGAVRVTPRTDMSGGGGDARDGIDMEELDPLPLSSMRPPPMMSSTPAGMLGMKETAHDDVYGAAPNVYGNVASVNDSTYEAAPTYDNAPTMVAPTADSAGGGGGGGGGGGSLMTSQSSRRRKKRAGGGGSGLRSQLAGGGASGSGSGSGSQLPPSSIYGSPVEVTGEYMAVDNEMVTD